MQTAENMKVGYIADVEIGDSDTPYEIVIFAINPSGIDAIRQMIEIMNEDPDEIDKEPVTISECKRIVYREES